MSGLVDPVELLKVSTASAQGSDFLADLLAQKTSSDPQRVRARTGVVTANNPQAYTCSVLVAGSPTAVGGIPVMGVMPGIGSTVVLGQTAGSYIVLGALGGATAPRAGLATIVFSASTVATPVTVNLLVPFPSGTVPVVTAIPVGSDARVTLAVSGVSASAFTFYGAFPTAISVSIPIAWHALYPTA